MTEIVTVQIDGKDNASGAIKKVGLSITDLNSAVMIAERVFSTVQGVMRQTVDVAQAYDQQVRDMMLSTGGTADETSRLIQVVDDMGVSYGTLKTALKMASKDGIEPNIESLAKLSDEYLKLAPGVQRNQFLMDKFGRGGLEMARAMEQGGDALRKMSAEMEGGLVLTQENIDASEEYRKNVDELNDSIQSVKVSIGNGLIPVINQSFAANKRWNESMKESAEATGTAYTRTNMYVTIAQLQKENTIAARDALESLKDETYEYTDANDGAVESLEDYNERMKEVTATNKEMLSLLGSMQSAEESYQTTSQKLTEERAKIEKERADAVAAGWWEGSEKIREYDEALAENSKAVQENEKEHEAANRKIVLGYLERKLTADGILDDAETNFLLEKGVEWGIYSDTIIDEMQAAIDEANRLTESLITEKTFTLNVQTSGAYTTTTNDKRAKRGDRAMGGPVMGGEMYMVGERGPEMFVPNQSGTIVPNNQLGSGEIVAAIERNRIDEARLGRIIESAMLRVSK